MLNRIPMFVSLSFLGSCIPWPTAIVCQIHTVSCNYASILGSLSPAAIVAVFSLLPGMNDEKHFVGHSQGHENKK